MKRKAVWIVCKNEFFYIDMALLSVVNNVEGIFILDTGSNDGTLDVIKSFQEKYPGKIVLEEKNFWSDENFRFGKRYNEVGARNYCMDRTTELFHPELLIQLDGDEIFNDPFFDILECMDLDALAHSTDLPTSPWSICNAPGAMATWNGGGLMRWEGVQLFDPHVRVWSTKYKVVWESRTGQDVIPRVKSPTSYPDYIETPDRLITREHIHFHLHRSFGPKSIIYYLTDFKHGYVAATGVLGIPYNKAFDQKFLEEKYPEYFPNGKFTPPAEFLRKQKSFSTPYGALPKFVCDKWASWGDWKNWNQA